MYRGTTPTLTFTLPFEVSRLEKVSLAFTQGGEPVLIKELGDFTLDGNNLILKLSEDDTLRFDDSKLWVEFQFRVLIEGNVLASKIMRVEVKRILYDGVLHEV